jgi:hypothetical protein
VTLAEKIDPERFVFVDECGTHTSLAPIYGYAARGEHLYVPAPRNRGKNTTLLSSMTMEGMGPSLAVEGSRPRPGSLRPTWRRCSYRACVRGRWW